MASSCTLPLSTRLSSLRFFAVILATALGWLSHGIVCAEGRRSERPHQEEVPVAQPVLQWTNTDGATIEASFEGMDGPDSVLLKPLVPQPFRLPLDQLSPDSRRKALSGDKAQTTWTTKDGRKLEASFEALDVSGRVVLKPRGALVFRCKMSELTPESQQQARNGGRPARLSVLVIGDSMSFGGFGKTLDHMLRSTDGVGTVNTYMACGTNPLSWLKVKPFASIKTYCGYWTIESAPDAGRPKEFIDTYGTPEGSTPEPHAVPKLEDLLERLQPDVLVIQCGNNFFSGFEDGVTVRKNYHGEMIRSYVEPFVNTLAALSSRLRKIYWVTPPQAGNVSTQIQDFVHEHIRLNANRVATIIDSRKLTRYPYKNMSADKEHFWGAEADAWGASVHQWIVDDWAAQSVWSQPLLHEAQLALANLVIPKAQAVTDDALRVMARLVAKTPIPAPEKFAPYQDCLVAYHYAIESILEGDYTGKEITVMHPAYIRLKKQPVEKLELGKSFDLRVRKLDATSIWNTIRREDASDAFDLDPYVLEEDEHRHPDSESAALPQEPPTGCPCQAR